MRPRLAVSIAVAVAVAVAVPAVTISLLWMTSATGAPPIHPAQVYCGTDRTEGDVTVLGLGLGGPPAPAPTASVVTGWAVHVGSNRGRHEQRLQVFRRVDGPVNSFYAVAQSSSRIVPSNSRQAFKTRIPVASGDLFALRGTVETFLCRGMRGVTSALHEGPTPVGSRYEFETETGLGVPLEVFLEPDEDGDGYGDETQDRCPRLPTTRNDCPTIKLRVEDAIARRRSMLLRVSVATRAQVYVVGSVDYPLRPGTRSGMVIELIESDHKTVRPGKVTAFEIKLSKRLRRRLSERPPKRPLEAELDVRAISDAGDTEEHQLTVPLPGRKSS
jgi:hypothetical protein